MKYDYEKVIDRYNTSSSKYDFAVEKGKPADVLPLWVADMDIQTAPEVIDAIKTRVEHGIFGYTMPKRDYFEAVANWFKTRHNFDADPEKFICTPGVVFAICTLIRAITKPNESVLICEPVYYPFAFSIEKNNRKLVVSELKLENGRYAVDFTDFEKKIV